MWSSTYCSEVNVHQILAELYPFEMFSKCFVSGVPVYLTPWAACPGGGGGGGGVKITWVIINKNLIIRGRVNKKPAYEGKSISNQPTPFPID